MYLAEATLEDDGEGAVAYQVPRVVFVVPDHLHVGGWTPGRLSACGLRLDFGDHASGLTLGSRWEGD